MGRDRGQPAVSITKQKVKSQIHVADQHWFVYNISYSYNYFIIRSFNNVTHWVSSVIFWRCLYLPTTFPRQRFSFHAEHFYCLPHRELVFYDLRKWPLSAGIEEYNVVVCTLHTELLCIIVTSLSSSAGKSDSRYCKRLWLYNYREDQNLPAVSAPVWTPRTYKKVKLKERRERRWGKKMSKKGNFRACQSR